jgi:O-6-methylguanine DNA methyltransferase
MKKTDPKNSFSTKIFDIVRRIPRGKTLTYQEVARRAGRPRAYRAIGNILNTNYDPDIPCHRVIRSDGTAGGWNRGKAAKRRKLDEEKKFRCFS